jgi:cytochrome P450
MLFSQVHLVTRYDDVLAILKDARFSSRAHANGIGLVFGRTILEMDGKAHIRHRNLIAPAFAPRALAGALPTVMREVAHGLIDDLEPQGRGDLVAQFTFTFPLRVMCGILGLPVADYDAFHRLALDLISIAADPPRAFAAAQEIADYLRPILAQRQAEPTGDLVSTLVHAEVDGQRLSEEEVLSFLRLLIPAGAETTYRLIGSMLFALLTHPALLEEVRADRRKVAWAIEEALRWESPLQHVPRETTEPVTIAGVDIPAGAMVMGVVGSANRDERRFPDPDRFDLHRPSEEHLAFGFGRHFCAGAIFARAEAEVAVNALLDRLPRLRLEAGETPRIVGLAFRAPERLPVRFD